MHKSIFISALLVCTFLASAKEIPYSKISKVNLTQSAFAPTAIDSLNWKLLGMIKFIKKADKEYGEIMYPQVSPLLKQKASKRITMSGFVIPIDNTTFALSKFVFASCFFCGNAGPETIMGIKFKGATPKLKTDQYVTLVGTFRINENDVEDWIYHIENAEIVKGK